MQNWAKYRPYNLGESLHNFSYCGYQWGKRVLPNFEWSFSSGKKRVSSGKKRVSSGKKRVSSEKKLSYYRLWCCV